MITMEQKRAKPRIFKFRDFLVVLICLSGAIYCFHLFRADLYNTINLQNEEPVGKITIKNNVVQRRLSDRALWDRLAVESPVYLGDLIRVAELSAATLYLDSVYIDLNENTIIRIQRSASGDGLLEIALDEGNISLNASQEGSNIMLNLMGHQVQAVAGTVLNASAGESGIEMAVTEGTVLLIEEGQKREVAQGTMLAIDAEGEERRPPSVVVRHPQPNARYLKNTPGTFSADFVWNRINLEVEELLRLDLARDRNFSRIIHVVEGLSSYADADIETGQWYWRLCLDEAVLSAGRFSVHSAEGPELLSPVTDSIYRFQDEHPSLRFQWEEVDEANSYIIEVSRNQDFRSTIINRNVEASFLVDSSLGQGTWYWRVMPVFLPVYEGRAAFSGTSFFRIEQSDIPEELGVVLPEEPVIVEEKPIEIRLISPAQGASLAGLTDLRQQTSFRWEAEGEYAQSRFILSGNSDPYSIQPTVEIANPSGRTVSLERLGQGTWYWTVEVHSATGLVSRSPVSQLTVLPIPTLPAPGNRQPTQGAVIGVEELRRRRSIEFSWSNVSGANAYIFTLYQVTAGGRRQIVRNAPESRTGWTLDNINILEPGTFVWQVEAVNRGVNNEIEQRGIVAENSFTLNVPLPGPVRLEEPGILYGR